MGNNLEVSVIGLDTSHAIEFPRRLQAPDCPGELKVKGLHVGVCLRFLTPFTDEKVLAERQQQLEEWGVRVTESFEEAVDGAEAILISINDPSFHLEYFKRCAPLGVPIFLDKPMAHTVAAAIEIVEIAEKHGTAFFTSSILRFVDQMAEAAAQVPRPSLASVYGPLGIAPAGSSIVWYGVHAFEMLEALLGTGSESVQVIRDRKGAIVHVTYDDDRRGVVELTERNYQYGATLRDDDKSFPFVADSGTGYTRLLQQIVPFFRGEGVPVMPNHSLEIMRLLEATDQSYENGRPVSL